MIIDPLTIASILGPPFLGGLGWLWHLNNKVVMLDTSLTEIGRRLERVEDKIDRLLEQRT